MQKDNSKSSLVGVACHFEEPAGITKQPDGEVAEVEKSPQIPIILAPPFQPPLVTSLPSDPRTAVRCDLFCDSSVPGLDTGPGVPSGED